MAKSTKGDGTPTTLDPAWQETLSDAVARVGRSVARLGLSVVLFKSVTFAMCM